MTLSIILPLLAILCLICLSGFFSGSETALTAASRPRMHMLEKDGNGYAKIVNRLLATKDRLIGALLLGNNLVNILATALATDLLLNLFGPSGVAIATVVMTVLVLVFAEVLPKTYALLFADKMALAIAPIVSCVVFIFAPVTVLIQKIVHSILYAFGVRYDEADTAAGLERLRGAIELHRSPTDDEGKEERDMLRSILDLAKVTVEEVMTHRGSMEMLDISEPPEQIIAAALRSPYSRLPLYEETQDNIVGIIHVKNLLRALQESQGQTRGLDVRTIAAEPWFVPETTTLADQLKTFRARHEHFALVVDEYGSLMGLVTLEDILEEIVGEINDESDVEIRGVRRGRQPGSYVVDGRVTIRDLNRELEWALPDTDYTTVAGLVMHEAQTIPEVGQSFAFYGFQFDVLGRHKNRITRIRISPQNGTAVSEEKESS